MFMTVVLPAPLPPSRASVWLAETSNDIFSTAKSLPKNFEMRETVRICGFLVGDAMALFSDSMGAATSAPTAVSDSMM
jgi:hypothetical protein